MLNFSFHTKTQREGNSHGTQTSRNQVTNIRPSKTDLLSRARGGIQQQQAGLREIPGKAHPRRNCQSHAQTNRGAGDFSSHIQILLTLTAAEGAATFEAIKNGGVVSIPVDLYLRQEHFCLVLLQCRSNQPQQQARVQRFHSGTSFDFSQLAIFGRKKGLQSYMTQPKLVLFCSAIYGAFDQFRPNDLPIVRKHFFPGHSSTSGNFNRCTVLHWNRPYSSGPFTNVRRMRTYSFCQCGLSASLFGKVFLKFHIFHISVTLNDAQAKREYLFLAFCY